LQIVKREDLSRWTLNDKYYLLMSAYVPLCCKSNFSFLEGASHPEELVEEAQRLGLASVALTDRDGVYGIVRAHVKAQELGIHLIIGSQVTMTGR
jgi:error-prone DNA polymerase